VELNNIEGQEIIEFYRTDRAYGFLSNLYKKPVIFKGREFPSGEHAYLFGKFKDEDTREWAMNLWKEAGLIEEPDYEKEAREYVKWVKLKHPRFDEVDRIECFTKAIALLFKAIEKLKKEK